MLLINVLQCCRPFCVAGSSHGSHEFVVAMFVVAMIGIPELLLSTVDPVLHAHFVVDCWHSQSCASLR
jgi:type IV secretory pathway VirB3-like protein